jgi:xylan 1,4-beta-xylosidase
MTRLAWIISVIVTMMLTSTGRADVLAYWRFEDRDVGEKLDAKAGSDESPLTMTSSAASDSNALRTFNTRPDLFPPCTSPTFVAPADLPQPAGKIANGRCARFIGSEDFYTASKDGKRPPIDSAALRQFTVEGLFKVAVLSARNGGKFQVVVGKDGKPVGSLPFQPFVVVIAGQDDKEMKRDCLSINVIDASGAFRVAASKTPLEADHWYAFAAVCDGRSLKLSINRFDGAGYRSEGEVAVSDGVIDCNETWTVGRGMFDRGPNSWFQGLIDEICISDEALPAEKLLTAGINTIVTAPAVEVTPIEKPMRCVEMLADPAALYHDGVYYLYGTGDTQGFDVYSSRDLKTWTKGPRIFERGPGVWGDADFWAPGIIERGRRFYLYYSAVGPLPDGGGRRSARINVAVADAPTGPFKEIISRMPLIGRAVIDPQPFTDADGKAYLYFVGDVNEGCGQVYVVRLGDDMVSTVGEPVLCVERSQPWEGPTWNEGPFVFRDGDTYVLMYSGEFWASPDYAVGFATSPSPLGPWMKCDENPILHRYAGLLGTGHNSMVRMPDGGMLMFFHAHRGPGDTRRDTYFAKMRVDRDARKQVMLKVEPWEPLPK